MAKQLATLFAVVVAVLAALPAHAQDPTSPDSLATGPLFTQGVRPTGMGLAYTGLATGSGAMFHNPGGIATKMMYQIEGAYEYNPAGSVLNATIVDSKTNPDVAAGIAYSYFFGRDKFSDSTGHSVRVGLAFPVIPERFSIGVAGRYLNVQVDDLEVINGVTVDAGAVIRATDQLQFGVAGQNLVDVCEKQDVCSSVAPTTVAGGVSYGQETGFLMSADGGVDLTSDPNGAHPFFEVGAEYFAADTVPLRLGYQRLQATTQNFLTAGLGVHLKAAGLDAGFRTDLDDPDYFFVNGSMSLYF